MIGSTGSIPSDVSDVSYRALVTTGNFKYQNLLPFNAILTSNSIVF